MLSFLFLALRLMRPWLCQGPPGKTNSTCHGDRPLRAALAAARLSASSWAQHDTTDTKGPTGSQMDPDGLNFDDNGMD